MAAVKKKHEEACFVAVEAVGGPPARDVAAILDKLHGDCKELKDALCDAQELEASKRATLPNEGLPNPTDPNFDNNSIILTLPSPLGLPAPQPVTQVLGQHPSPLLSLAGSGWLWIGRPRRGSFLMPGM